MYLLIGSELDPCCQMVGAALVERGCQYQTINSPFTGSISLGWDFDNDRSISHLTLNDGSLITDAEIDGVLVRHTVWMDPAGWQSDDLTYMYTETQAAVLGWLWSLTCPVVGRLESSVWYRPQAPLASWQPLLNK